ncbi:MucB/RseB C-terminal domain-containing protein [Herbaspirillum rubrisubalbicans]|uniref:Transcriptional regulator n=1 Tax=Herbaspirillum rubrisubalbicans TaxID=80842 RepID=A0ABX9C6V5_9BURK|nr:MucB/RseB C-terminal domain-containing protein [Herbaspirillum rubrisubalbicans]MCP1571979.1 sigma-E factor negative regulatory protein RseB [Herbaspirillum rubrisubalbicans]RAM66126.1 transcriptional regulator [Herbaspirillum rubrisubalbicans]
MRQRRRLYGVLCFLSVLLAPSAHAADGVASPTVSAATASSPLLAQLQKMQSAAQRLNYSGSFVYQQAALIRSSRVTHVVAGKSELEKLELLDGRPSEFVRDNEDVASYLPDERLVRMERRVTRDVFPAIVDARPEDLASHYRIQAGADERVAGRTCHAIVLEPRDSLRYGYRFCTDQASGLLLRAQTLDAKGEVVEQIAFTQIEIGAIDRARVNPTYRDTRGWRIEKAAMAPADLSAWQVTPPPGFRKIQQVRRLISDSAPEGAAPAQNRPAQREVSQIVFSDGLAAISVFIEPGSQGREESTIQQGAMNILGRRYGNYWLTVVGEVPAAAIRQVANSIELKSK